MGFNLIPLSVIPEIRITDKGLVLVPGMRIVPLFEAGLTRITCGPLGNLCGTEPLSGRSQQPLDPPKLKSACMPRPARGLFFWQRGGRHPRPATGGMGRFLGVAPCAAFSP